MVSGLQSSLQYLHKKNGCRFLACELYLKKVYNQRVFQKFILGSGSFFKSFCYRYFYLFFRNVIFLKTRRDKHELGWSQTFPLFQPFYSTFGR